MAQRKCPVLSIAQYFDANPDKESGRIEGRRHLMRSMTDMRIDLDSEVFNMINITCHTTQGSVDV